MIVAIPQEIISPLTNSAQFVTLTVKPGGEQTVWDTLTNVSATVRSIRFPHPDEGLVCIVGIGSDLWDRMFGGPRPAKLHPFTEIKGEKHTAPATGGDLFLHIRSDHTYPAFEMARRLLDQFGDAVTITDQVAGFRYYDRRDLLGFVDGTANPTGQRGEATVLIDDDEPFDGGSYLIVQKYLHDLPKWNAQTVEEQEAAIGRYQLTDIEIPDAKKASNSHVVLNTITEPDGTQRDIVRDNMPFGSLAEGVFGTFFAGYAADPGVTEKMLERMFVGAPPGNSDQILEVSTAVTGALFYIPTSDFLDNPPPLRTKQASA